jgi:putative urate catabolism protein
MSYPRDLVGYGQHPPDPRWPGGARLALQIVMNYEEGGERSILHGDSESEAFLQEVVSMQPLAGVRNLQVESMYEYGSRAGFWRLMRMFAERGLAISVFAVGMALDRHPEAARAIVEAGHEVVSHGYRWIDYQFVDEAVERAHVRLAVESITRDGATRLAYTGRLHAAHPWSSRRGFLYDADAYNDDLPYWEVVAGRPHLVVPYTLDNNDMKFAAASGFATGDEWLAYVRDAFDVLYAEGAHHPKMMSVGLHTRLMGRPGRAAALGRVLDHVQRHDDVWICRRIDIARHWIAHHPIRKELTMTIGLDGCPAPARRGLLALITTAQAQTAAPAAPPGVAASVGSDTISMADLEQSVAIDLARLEQQRQSLLDRKLNQLIGDRLLAQEAARRGVSVDKLLKEEVDDKTPAVTQAEVNGFIAQNRARMPKADEASCARAWPSISSSSARPAARVPSPALGGTQVRVYLKEAEPVRVKVDPGGLRHGPPSAPVTIVEFSDFQCPFCRGWWPPSAGDGPLSRPRALVFRDFPIPSLHPDAPLAHEAARCAGEQGQFWAYHDLLFERTTVNATALKQYAADLKLDDRRFAECLDSGRSRAAITPTWRRDRLGCQARPSSINGGTPGGQRTARRLQRAIDRELARTAATRSSAGQASSARGAGGAGQTRESALPSSR